MYFPLLAAQNHPAVQNLNAVKGEFTSTLDTLESPGVRSSILLRTSINSKAVAAPHTVSLEASYNRPDPRDFTQRDLVTGVLFEGKFTSAYAQRIASKAAGEGLPQLKESPVSEMAVFSDGDFI